jgi:L-ribulose-5-phosphate 3-epimerase
MSGRLAVCSWSLRPAGVDDLIEHLGVVGVPAVQLALDPIRTDPGDGPWGEVRTFARLRHAGVAVVSGMIGFRGEDYSTLDSIRKTGGVAVDADWAENLAAAQASAAIAARSGIGLVTFHAGFIPHQRGRARALMLIRLREIVDAFDARGVRVAFETGQESAETLLDALAELERPHVGVNFDPANMILYGMGDPIAALEALSSRVAQVHVKDARPAKAKGEWGSEVPAGEGAVDWATFFKFLARRAAACDTVIEREAGQTRVADIAKAAKLVRKLAAGSPARRTSGAKKGKRS